MASIVSAKLESGYRFVAETTTGHKIEMDAGEKIGGADTAARPSALPFAGLAGCTGIDTLSILKKMKQEYTSFAVDVEGIDQTTEYPKHWTEIKVVFTVEGEVDENKLVKSINLSREKYCGVSAILKGKVKIHYGYILNGESTDLPDSE
jgi:putative redox protein